MGEYATFNGEHVKIGTCEDMYYLRADQVHLVPGGDSLDALDVIRFRFPWPDEDSIEPGHFDNHNRGLALYGVEPPTEIEHGSVQFVAQAGYNVCLPCPESGDNGHGLHVHRNGFSGPVRLVQQAWRGGNLVGICQCGGCGAAYNMPTIADAAPVIEAILKMAEREAHTAEMNDTPGNADIARQYVETARRLKEGYERTRAARSS